MATRGRPRQHPDIQTKWLENKRKQREDKKRAASLLVLAPAPAVCAVPARPDNYRRTRASGDEEWYTRKHLLDPVRAVLGVIDLDPASCAMAQHTVQARTYYTKQQDGLQYPWHGKIFLNPPYKEPKISRFCGYLLGQLDVGHTTEAILLVPNSTHTRWFQSVAPHAQMIAFPRGKKSFDHPTKQGNSPVSGSALLYFGPHVERFCEVFAPLGLFMPALTITAPGSQLTFADAQQIRRWHSPPRRLIACVETVLDCLPAPAGLEPPGNPFPCPGARPITAACFRQTRRRLASVRQQEEQRSTLRGFRREMAARPCERLRGETCLQLQTMRQLLHALFDSVHKKG
jgi:hypothetical protein